MYPRSLGLLDSPGRCAEAHLQVNLETQGVNFISYEKSVQMTSTFAEGHP